MLHQVEAGLGGVVAQCAIVDTRLRTERAVLLLQMLRITKKEKRESGNVRQCSCLRASYAQRKKLFSQIQKHYTEQCKYIWVDFSAQIVIKVFLPFNSLAPK